MLYVLYISLVEVRERSHEKDSHIFKLCDLIHNISLQLRSQEDAEKAYQNLADNVALHNIQSCLDKRLEECYARNPQFHSD